MIWWAPGTLTSGGRRNVRLPARRRSVLGRRRVRGLSCQGRDPSPVRAAVDGDSLLLDAGPYKTAKPANVDVTTNGVSRMEGGMLVGTFVSQFALAGGDSIVRGRLRGTRIP